MGGIVILISAIFATIFCINLTNIFVIGGIATIILFGLIGIKDDISKIVGQNNTSGLSPKVKFGLQLLSAFSISYLLYKATYINNYFYIPFYKYPLLNLGWFIMFFWVVVMIASSNAVNLTDGLDGLATVPSIFSMLSLGVLSISVVMPYLADICYYQRL